MAKKEILITGSDRVTGKLTLSDGGRTRVYNRDDDESRTIIWGIDHSQKKEVKSFLLDGKYANQFPPFEMQVPGHHDTQVRLKVKKDTPPIEWEYNIIWRDKFDKDHKHDPKISVLPSLLHSDPEADV